MATIAEMEGIVAGILASIKAEEEARKKRNQEEEELRKKRNQEEEELRKKRNQEEEELRKKRNQEEEELRKKRKQEEEELRKKRNQEEEELRKKNDRELAELKKKTEEAKREAAEAKREADAAHKEAERSFNQLNKTVNHWVGRLGNTTGYLTEMIIVPGIRPQMAKHGHKFDSLSARKEFFRKDGSAFTEVDLILENGKEVMIVEIKTHLTVEDVKYHLKRLELLRKGEKEAKMTGRSIISGVAGLIIDDSAKKLADNRGMYVIRINENEESIEVEAPKKGVGRW